jgi:hypothetical protein
MKKPPLETIQDLANVTGGADQNFSGKELFSVSALGTAAGALIGGLSFRRGAAAKYQGYSHAFRSAEESSAFWKGARTWALPGGFVGAVGDTALQGYRNEKY